MRGAAPSQPIPTIFGTLGGLTDVIHHTNFRYNRSRGFSLAGTQKWYVSTGKLGRPQHSAARLARDELADHSFKAP
jgi:hypothetical protein